jgi:hypothetical protein
MRLLYMRRTGPAIRADSKIFLLGQEKILIAVKTSLYLI